MKHLILLALLVSCATPSLKEYKEKHFILTQNDPRPLKELYDLLVTKMRKCYKDDLVDRFMHTGIEAKFSEKNQTASIAYLYDNGVAIKRAHHIDLAFVDNQTVIKTYSEGGAFTTEKDFRRNVPAWLKGEQVWCRGHGKI